MPIPKGKSKGGPSIGKFTVAGGKFSAQELGKKFGKEGQGQVIYLKPDTDIRLRFFTEPDDWRYYTEHQFQENGRWQNVPCIGEGCPLCESEVGRQSDRILIPVWDVERKKVRLLKAGSRLAQDLLKFYQKGKLLDRDYNLMREGEGIDTRYLLDAEDKEKRPEAKKAEAPDLDDILEGWVKSYYSGSGNGPKKSKSKDEEEFEEDEDKPKKKSKKSDDDEDDDDEKESESEDDNEDEEEEKPKKKKKLSDDDDEDDDDEESDDDDEDEKPTKKKSSDDDDDEEDAEEEDDDDEDEAPAKPKKPKKKKK